MVDAWSGGGGPDRVSDDGERFACLASADAVTPVTSCESAPSCWAGRATVSKS